MSDRHLQPVDDNDDDNENDLTDEPGSVADSGDSRSDSTDDGETVFVDEHVVASSQGFSVRVSRRQILASWLRDREAFASAAGWALSQLWFVVRYHTAHAPLYALRLAARSPVGAWRVARGVGLWVADATFSDSREALVHSVSSDSRGADALFRMSEQHRSMVRARLLTLLVLIVGLAATGLWAMVALDWYETLFVGAGLVLTLGAVGHSTERPIIDRAVSKDRPEALTSELIVTALGALGLGKMNTALRLDESGSAIQFVHPIARDGPGWRADLNLPVGVTAGEVIDKRASLASGLRRPLSCVWPMVDGDAHEGRLILYVTDKPLSSGDKVRWPLTARGATNVFDPIPIGVDQRGRPVAMNLVGNSALIGAVPGMGKTFLLRLIALAAGLDPRAELHLFNLKGGTDLDALEGIAHAYRTGEEDDDMAYLLTDLRDLAKELRRRYKAIRQIPREVAPESKVTDQLASKRSLGFHPVVLFIDECQVGFEHPEHGKEATTIVTDLIKRGRAVGIIVVVATQRPDAGSIPPGIRDNIPLRFCFKVTSQPANDMVLGTSMYKAGYRATQFGRKDTGIALFGGETADPVIVRVAYVDNPMAETIVARARAARAAKGLLTGLAAGQDLEIDDTTASVLDHILHVWPAGHDKVWYSTLADRLEATYPGVYDRWEAEQVSAALRPLRIETVQIKRAGQNRKGIRHTELVQAVNRAKPPHDLTVVDDDEGDRPDGEAGPSG